MTKKCVLRFRIQKRFNDFCILGKGAVVEMGLTIATYCSMFILLIYQAVHVQSEIEVCGKEWKNTDSKPRHKGEFASLPRFFTTLPWLSSWYFLNGQFSWSHLQDNYEEFEFISNIEYKWKLVFFCTSYHKMIIITPAKMTFWVEKGCYAPKGS